MQHINYKYVIYIEKTWYFEVLNKDQDKTDKIIERFPFSCDSSILPNLPGLNQGVTDARNLFKELIAKAPNNRECEKLCDTDCDQDSGILCGLLSDVDQCSTLQNTIAKQICDPDQNDERRTMEPPATQWIFTCPMRKFLKVHVKWPEMSPEISEYFRVMAKISMFMSSAILCPLIWPKSVMKESCGFLNK